MNLATIQGKLSRTEMKRIMAGSGGCEPDGTACGNGQKCKATSTSCTCGGGTKDDPVCMKAISTS